MAELRVTELDFNNIKGNLKNFLQGQSEFSDYNFTGSALNVLLDVLAYNTHYNAILAHLVANEMFLDTAVKRSSVVSIAKTLGYTPRSAVSSVLRATITATPTNLETAASSIVLSTSDIFTGTIDSSTYTFTPKEDYVALLVDGTYVFENVELVQGSRLVNTFTVKLDTLSGPFTIPVEKIDISSLNVLVYENESRPLPFTVFKRADGFVDISDTTNAFWIEEQATGKYQISFGDDIIGKQLEVGNVVVVSYIATDAAAANGIDEVIITSIAGVPVTEIVVSNPSSAGSEKESIDSIRKNAPLYNSTRNRAVTASDYKTLISTYFDKAKSVSVWGGEQNDPPIFGKIFIAIDPRDDYVLTELDKDYIVERILRPRSVISMQHEFVDPEYVYLGFNCSVNYDSRKTTLSASEVASLVKDEIENYFTTELSTLNKTFFVSKLSDVIEASSSAIVGNLLDMSIQLRIIPELKISFNKVANFLTAVEPNTIVSTNFVTSINGVLSTVFIKDFNDSTYELQKNTGTLKLMNVATQKPLQTVGTIDYATGKIKITNLMVEQLLASAADIRINAKPQELGKNISSFVKRTTDTSQYAVSPLASRNVIIKLNDSSSISSIGLKPGLIVTATPFIDE